MLRLVSILALATFVTAPELVTASSRVVADDVLARASAAAVRGRVVALESSWDSAADAIYTYVTLDVLQSWGLQGTPARIVVKQLGGIVNDVALVIGGQAHFEVGEECIVFLDVRPRDRTLSVAGLEHGKWTMTASTNPAQAMAREVRGSDPAVVVSRDYRSLDELQALAALVGQRASAAAAVVAPTAARGAAGGDGREMANYTLLSSGTPARWHEADGGASVYVDTENGGHGQIAGGGLTQIGRAAQLWRDAGSLQLHTGGTRGPRCFNNNEPSDGRISLTYNDPCGEIADESWTLAIGGAYFSSSDVRSVNNVNYWKIVKGMIVTDNAPWKYSGMSTGCYEELVAHELGHAIGFGHAANRPALMYPAITSDCNSRSSSIPLSSDDRDGMAAVYPEAGGEVVPPPNAPTGLSASISGSTVSIAWTAPSQGPTPSGYTLYAGSAAGLSNVGLASTTATVLVVPNVPNGTYYIRVKAVGTGGSSPATSDYMVTMQVAPPAPPVNVTGMTGAGRTAVVTWQPSGAGGSPSLYRVSVGYAPGATSFVFETANPSIGGSGIAPATYYVRVAAVNGGGISQPSAEIALTVQ